MTKLFTLVILLSTLHISAQKGDGYTRSGYVETFGVYENDTWEINNLSGTEIKFLRIEAKDSKEYINITLIKKKITTHNVFQIMFKDENKEGGFFMYICLDPWGGMVALMFNNDWFRLLFNFREGCEEEDNGNWRNYYEGIFLKRN